MTYVNPFELCHCSETACGCAPLGSFHDQYRALLRQLKPRRVFEWGSGISTRIALAMDVDRVVAIEPSEHWARKLPADPRLMVRIAAPGSQSYHDNAGCEDFDLFFVDCRERAACLDVVRTRAKASAVVCLHDAQRSRYNQSLRRFSHVRYYDRGLAAGSMSDLPHVTGVLYLASGDQLFREMAEQSRRSVYTHWGLPATIVERSAAGAASRDHITRLHQITPYDRTIFLDADTLVFDAPGELLKPGFHAALEADAITVGRLLAHRWWRHTGPVAEKPLMNQLPRDQPYFNSGVLAWDASQQMDEFFRIWNEEWKRFPWLDQPAFVRTIVRTKLCPSVLPRRYNCFVRQGRFPRDPVVLHAAGVARQQVMPLFRAATRHYAALSSVESRAGFRAAMGRLRRRVARSTAPLSERRRITWS